jgi:hypothetical protein
MTRQTKIAVFGVAALLVGAVACYLFLQGEGEDHADAVSAWPASAGRAVQASTARAPKTISGKKLRVFPTEQENAKAEKAQNPEIGFLSVGNFRQSGDSTPAEAFSTFVAALFQGDEDRVAGMFVINDADRVKISKLWDSLPENRDRVFGSPEKMLQTITARDFLDRVDAICVKDVKVIEEDRVIITTWQQKGGLPKGKGRFEMVLVNGHWGVVVPTRVVDRLADKMRLPE